MNTDLIKIQQLLGKRNISDISCERDLCFSPIKTVWITLNRSCNFRCPHCYAKDVGFRKDLEMPLAQVKELVDFAKDIGAKIIILIGGEPLLYKDLFPVLDYIQEKGLISTIASNGCRLGDDAFFQKIKASPLGSIVFSLKAGSAELYQQLTQSNSFDMVKKAIANFSELTSHWNSYTIVLTKEILDDLENIAHLIEHDKNKALRINFCTPVLQTNGGINGNSLLDIPKLISHLVEHYEKINTILEGRLLIQQAFPKCFWPADFLSQLEQKKQVTFSCHLYNRTGLVFDTQRRLLLCNAWPDFPLAQFGKDFSCVAEFKKFFMQPDVCQTYKDIFKYTAKNCVTCADHDKCLGGCPLNWFHYSGSVIDKLQEGHT